MGHAEAVGVPIVGVGRIKDGERELFGLVVAMSARREDVQEVLDLMREKYPNADVPDLNPKVEPIGGKRGSA